MASTNVNVCKINQLESNRVIVFHMSLDGQFNVFCVDTITISFLQTHGVTEDKRVTADIIFFEDFMTSILKIRITQNDYVIDKQINIRDPL